MNISNTATMKWASALSLEIDSTAATAEVINEMKPKLGGKRPDALFLFLSSHHRSHCQAVLASILKQLGPGHLLGCSGESVIGDWHEAEQVPALALAGAVLPNVEMQPIRLADSKLPGPDCGPRLWEERVGVKASLNPRSPLPRFRDQRQWLRRRGTPILA